jgi:hypothetical protein
MPGVELDVDLGPVEVVAQLAASFDGLRDEMQSAARAEKRRRDQLRAQTPMDIRKTGSFTTDATPHGGAINHGGPQAGYYWLLRRLVLGPVASVTQAAAQVEVYVTGNPSIADDTGASNPLIVTLRPTTEMMALSILLPNVATFSGHQVPVQPGEKLVVVYTATGLSATTTYVSAAEFEVHRAVAVAEEFTA